MLTYVHLFPRYIRFEKKFLFPLSFSRVIAVVKKRAVNRFAGDEGRDYK